MRKSMAANCLVQLEVKDEIYKVGGGLTPQSQPVCVLR